MADVNKMIFEGMVDEADVGKLEEGMPLSISIGALPDQRFGGVLNFISPSGVENNGIVEFEIKADVNLIDDVFLSENNSSNDDVILSVVINVLYFNYSILRFDVYVIFFLSYFM